MQNLEENTQGRGFEIETLSEPYSEVAVPIPGGCNSSNSGCSCSNDEPVESPDG